MDTWPLPSASSAYAVVTIPFVTSSEVTSSAPWGRTRQRQQRRQENTRYSFHVVPPRRLSAAPPSRPFDAPIIPPSPRILFLNCPKCHSCALKCNSPPKKPFPRRAALSFRGRSAPTAICPLCHSEPVTDLTGVGIRSPSPPARSAVIPRSEATWESVFPPPPQARNSLLSPKKRKPLWGFLFLFSLSASSAPPARCPHSCSAPGPGRPARPRPRSWGRRPRRPR